MDEMKNDLDTVVNLKQARHPTFSDVIDRILDKGIVIEYQVDHVSVGGIHLPVTVEARFVVASLDTQLEYAEPLSKFLLGETNMWLQDLSISQNQRVPHLLPHMIV